LSVGGEVSVSVALAARNGEWFLLDQLESIAAQRPQPFELVISDDNSSDETVRVAQRFAERAPFRVKVYSQHDSGGLNSNFARAIWSCRGDVIALSDQDDVWAPDKLSRMVSVFGKSPNVGAVFSDAELVDESLVSLGQTLWDNVGFTRSERRKFFRGQALEVLVRRNIVAGFTLAFRSSFKSLLLPIPNFGFYDYWIAVLVAAVSELRPIPSPLVQYRQHQSNTTGARQSGWLNQADLRNRYPGTYDHQHMQFVAMRDRIVASNELFPPRAGSVGLIKGKIDHSEHRASLSVSRPKRLVSSGIELFRGRYHRYSHGLKSFAFDVFLRKIPSSSEGGSI
jgi:glycosyl transferase family 2